MGGAVMAKRQDEHLQIDGRRALWRAVSPDEEGLRPVGRAFDHPRGFLGVVARPNVQERLAAQLPAEQRIGAAADDAEGKAAVRAKIRE